MFDSKGADGFCGQILLLLPLPVSVGIGGILNVKLVVVRRRQLLDLGDVRLVEKARIQMRVGLVQPLRHVAPRLNLALDAAQRKVVPCLALNCHWFS